MENKDERWSIIREFTTAQRTDGRYVLVDPSSGEVLDDAQGYGYRSEKKAQKAGWFKFSGGKAKLESFKVEAERFWRENETFSMRLFYLGTEKFKRSSVKLQSVATKLAASMGIAGFNPAFLGHWSIELPDKLREITTQRDEAISIAFEGYMDRMWSDDRASVAIRDIAERIGIPENIVRDIVTKAEAENDQR